MRETAMTGTTGLSSMPQIICARMNCALRRASFEFGISALARTVCVELSTCGEMKVIWLEAKSVARAVDDLNGKVHLQLRGLFDGDINVGFDVAGAIDGGELRGGDDAVADADGDVAVFHAGAGRDDLKVMQLDLLLIDLSIEGVKLGLSLIESRARLIEILLADDSGGGEAADAIEILLRPFDRAS